VKKASIWVSLGTLALLGSAWAGDFKLLADDPVASFSIPASWKPSEYQGGVEATSDDDSVYLAIETTALSSESVIEESMKEALNYLGKKGVQVDESTAKRLLREG
jgi:hypothetical protein